MTPGTGPGWTGRMSSIASPRSWTPRAIPAWALAAVVAAAYLVLAPPSADLAAQEYRADLGLVLWDNGWYGGHHMPGYSVLFPPLAGVLGPRLVGALSAVAAAWLFERLVRDLDGGRAAALWFAVATATSLITGRLTFALGVAVGLGGGARRRARPPRLGRAPWRALASLASPVAGGFVALAAAAWWLDRRALVAGGARPPARVAPAVALAVAFPEGGSFPFVASSFWPALAASVAVGLVVPRDARVRAHRRRALRAWRWWRASRWRRRWAATSCASARSSPDRCVAALALAHQPPRARPAGAAAPVLAMGGAGRRLGARRRRRRPCTSATTTACSASSATRGGGALPRRDPVHRQPLGVALGGAARAAGPRMGAPGRPRAQRALL